MPRIYFNSNAGGCGARLIIPEKFIIDNPKSGFKIEKLQSFHIVDHMEKDSDYLPMDISQEALDTLMEFVETKEKFENLKEDLTEKLYPEENRRMRALHLMQNCVERGKYQTAYELMNKYRINDHDIKLSKNVVIDFYCGLRDIDKAKAYELPIRFQRDFRKIRLGDIYKELETEYLHRLEQEKRIMSKK